MKPACPFKPTKSMGAYANSLIRAILAGRSVADNDIARKAKISPATIKGWRWRHPVKFRVWLRQALIGVNSPEIDAVIIKSFTKTVKSYPDTHRAVSARLFLQVVEDLEPSQDKG